MSSSYEEIKAETIRLYNDVHASMETKRLAEIAMALCDRVAELEQRHITETHRLETWLKNLRR